MSGPISQGEPRLDEGPSPINLAQGRQVKDDSHVRAAAALSLDELSKPAIPAITNELSPNNSQATEPPKAADKATEEKKSPDPAQEKQLSFTEIFRASVDIIKIAYTGAHRLAWTRVGLAIPTAAAGSAMGLLTGTLIDSVSKVPDVMIQDPKMALWALLGGSVGFGLAKTSELITSNLFQAHKVQTVDTYMREGLRSQPPNELISKPFQKELATVRSENWRVYGFCDKPLEIWTNLLQLAVSATAVGYVGAAALPPLIIGAVAQGVVAFWDRRDYEKMYTQLKDKYQLANNVWYQFLVPSVLKEMVLTQKDDTVAEIGRTVTDEIKEAQNKVNTRSAMRRLGAEVVGLGALGMALYNCVKMVQTGAMTTGELSAVLVGAAQFSGATTGLIENTVGQLKSISIVKKFLDLCKPSEPPARSAEVEQAIKSKLVDNHTTPKIIFTNVSFSYPAEPEEDSNLDTSEKPEPFALKNVSFTLRPGEVIGLAGKNGAGKSTIINLLLGLYKPEGSISINEVDLGYLHIKSEWLPRVGILLQDHSLFTGLNLQEQIVSKVTKDFSTLRQRFTLERVSEASGVASVVSKINGGYKAIIGDSLTKGLKLSGGQQQKVALARALASRPDILILDEPTASLDSTAAKELLPNLRKFCEEQNYRPTILVVTHKMDLFPQCDRILVLKDGEVHGEGTHTELMQDQESIYCQLFRDYRNE
jgi:ABC-type multidrug transport system fused ATPase/permease subunit